MSELSVTPYSVECEDSSIGLPHPTWTFAKYDSFVVILFKVERSNPEESDFTLPSPMQNLVAITDKCEVGWIVTQPSDIPAQRESRYHRKLWKLGDRLITKAGREPSRLHEIALSNGEIVQTWEDNEFGIAGELIELDGRIGQIKLMQDVYILVTPESLHGFDIEGTRLWQKPRDYKLRELDEPRPKNGKKWILAQDHGDEDEQYVWAMKRMGGRHQQRYSYKIDPRTGKFIEAQLGPSAWLET